jgi:hypothetical protein
MATTASAGNPAPPGGGNVLTQKFGPLALWAWLVILTAIALGLYLYEKRKSGSSSSSASSTDATPGDVGQPGVVVINQDGPPGSTPPQTVESPPTQAEIPGKGKNPGAPTYQTHAYQLSAADSLSQIAGANKLELATIRTFNPGLYKQYGKSKPVPKGTSITLPYSKGGSA